MAKKQETPNTTPEATPFTPAVTAVPFTPAVTAVPIVLDEEGLIEDSFVPGEDLEPEVDVYKSVQYGDTGVLTHLEPDLVLGQLGHQRKLELDSGVETQVGLEVRPILSLSPEEVKEIFNNPTARSQEEVLELVVLYTEYCEKGLIK